MSEDKEAPGAKRHDLDDSDDVVDGGVVGPLRVAVLESGDTQKQRPERKRGDEQPHLPHGRDAVDR